MNKLPLVLLALGFVAVALANYEYEYEYEYEENVSEIMADSTSQTEDQVYEAIVQHTSYKGTVEDLRRRTARKYQAYKAAAEKAGSNDAEILHKKALRLLKKLDLEQPASGAAFDRVKAFARHVLRRMLDRNFGYEALRAQVEEIVFLETLKNNVD